MHKIRHQEKYICFDGSLAFIFILRQLEQGDDDFCEVTLDNVLTKTKTYFAIGLGYPDGYQSHKL